DHDAARGIAVEAVDEPGGFALAVGQALEQAVEVALLPAPALRGESVRLVEDIELVVLVEDEVAQERRVPWVATRGRLRGGVADWRNADHLPRLEPRRGLHPAAVDAHLAGAQEL